MVRAVVFVALSATMLTACTSGTGEPDDEAAGASPEPSATIRLVIPDGNIRQPDVSCTGARPFRFAHPQAPYVVENPAGEPVASGELPQGRAEPAWSMDMGDERQPTACVMMIDISGLESVDGHALVIGDQEPEPVLPNPNLDGIPEVVLS